MKILIEFTRARAVHCRRVLIAVDSGVFSSRLSRRYGDTWPPRLSPRLASRRLSLYESVICIRRCRDDPLPAS